MIRKGTLSLLLTTVVAGGLALLAPQPALALSTSPDPTGWGIGGKTYAAVGRGNIVYVGGTFNKVFGPLGEAYTVGNLTAFANTTGTWIPSFAPMITSGTSKVKVNALALSPDGSTLYVGGRFDSVNGRPAKNFAAIDPTTGSLLPSININANQPVNAILPGPNLVYLGGAFKLVNGQPRVHLAALNYDGSLNNTWKPTTEAGNCPPPYYNANTCSNGGDGIVRALAMSPDGKSVYVGGEYYYVNGRPRNCIARVSATDGSLDPWAVPWTQIIDDPQNHLPGPNMAWAIIPTTTRLYVGFGRLPNYLQTFRLDNGNSGDTVWKQGTPGNVESLALSPDGTRLFVGGHFGTAVLDFYVGSCTAWVHGLVSVNPATGAYNCDWIPPIKPFGGQNAPGSGQSPPNYVGAWAMKMIGNALWVGGDFTSISGQTYVSGIARFTIAGPVPPPVPALGSFSPTTGPIGTSVTITGFGFTGATAVQFGGVGASFTVNSLTRITATVPAGAVTGPITVVAPGGMVDSGAKKFHVT